MTRAVFQPLRFGLPGHCWNRLFILFTEDPGADGAVGGFRRRGVAAPLLHSDRQIGVAECGAPDRSDSEIQKVDIVAVRSLLATPSESSQSFFRQ